MKGLRLENLSERQQVLAVILGAGILIFALWFFLLLPLNTKRHRLERDIGEMADYLAKKNYLLPEEALLGRKEDAYRHNRAVHGAWDELSERMATFAGQEKLQSPDIGHIDFKVALFQVRQRLMAKSRALGTELPYGLGMNDEVKSNEDSRRLMLQLRAVEKLVGLTLDIGIARLRNIEPLKPVEHATGQKNLVYMEEYPVRLDFRGDLESLFRLFGAVSEPDRVFVFRQLRVHAAPGGDGAFDVSAVLSALLFVRDPDEVIPPPQEVKWVPPKGY
ncbi:MAG: hypothetical protein FJ224_08640 [Lentisphaerae bacterium]|nr:hypothetical protein [Lentisphaerota bacterium]